MIVYCRRMNKKLLTRVERIHSELATLRLEVSEAAEHCRHRLDVLASRPRTLRVVFGEKQTLELMAHLEALSAHLAQTPGGKR